MEPPQRDVLQGFCLFSECWHVILLQLLFIPGAEIGGTKEGREVEQGTIIT